MIVENLIKVGMADLKVVLGKDGILKTTGLGSCVGVILYDQTNGVAGMAHVMLPNSIIAREGIMNIAKYADTAIPDMLERMIKLGANQGRMIAKLAGGAQMFAFSGTSDTMRIGPRNVETCKEILNKLQIPIRAEDTGANYGRTIEFHNSTGMLLIRSVQQGVKEI
ncbi:MAG: chemotaxis protein CheD [Paenibacillaceae bacterium]